MRLKAVNIFSTAVSTAVEIFVNSAMHSLISCSFENPFVKMTQSMPIKRTIGFLLAVVLLTACAPQPSAEPARPTNTPVPTFTPTPEIVATPVDPAAVDTSGQDQPAQQPPADQSAGQTGGEQQAQADPTATPTPEPPTPTPAPAEPQVTVNQNMNVRGGPGTNYFIIGTATAGQQFPLTGKNPAGDWWQINYNGQSGWVFGGLVTAANAGGVQVALNIPAPPPTATPVPPTPTPVPPPPAQPTQPPAPRYKFNIAVVGSCQPNAGVTYVQGKTYVGGQPQSGHIVAFSYAPDGPIVARIQSGPHEGYPNWDAGFYSHILQSNGPREGNWSFWVVDSSGNRISEIAQVRTDGEAGPGKCQQAIIDFDSR